MALSIAVIEKRFNEIINLIAIDGLPMIKAVSQLKTSTETFYEWIDKDVEKANRYTRACSQRAEGLFEECLEIANTTIKGETTKVFEDGTTIVTKGDMYQHRRLMIDTRKWMVGKLEPKKYGDKVQQEHSGDIVIKTITGMEIK